MFSPCSFTVTTKALSEEEKNLSFGSAETVLVKLKSPKLVYEAGDHLAVFPNNTEDEVNLVASRCMLPMGVSSEDVISLTRLHSPSKTREYR